MLSKSKDLYSLFSALRVVAEFSELLATDKVTTDNKEQVEKYIEKATDFAGGKEYEKPYRYLIGG